MSATGFVIVNDLATITKADDENLDYGIEFADLLETGETISSASWTVGAGLTGGAESESGTVASKWLSGGTAGLTYEVDCEATTSAGRVFERCFNVRVVARR